MQRCLVFTTLPPSRRPLLILLITNEGRTITGAGMPQFFLCHLLPRAENLHTHTRARARALTHMQTRTRIHARALARAPLHARPCREAQPARHRQLLARARHTHACPVLHTQPCTTHPAHPCGHTAPPEVQIRRKALCSHASREHARITLVSVWHTHGCAHPVAQ